MNHDIDIETPDTEEVATVDANFNQAKMGAELGGLELQPWSPARKITAQSMGMLYPHIGDDGYEALARTGIYPGALRDVIIFTWLCTQRERSVITRAQRKPIEAWETAQAWADKAGLLDMASTEFQEAYLLFSQKMGAETAAQSRPEIPAGSEGNDLPKT